MRFCSSGGISNSLAAIFMASFALGAHHAASENTAPRSRLSKLYVFDVARARASPTSRLGHSRCSSPSLRRPLCVRRWSQGLQNQNWPLPTTPLANRREILGPRLRRLSSGARDALRLLGAYVGPTRGGGWVACPKKQCCLVPPRSGFGVGSGLRFIRNTPFANTTVLDKSALWPGNHRRRNQSRPSVSTAPRARSA
jgi:hypothetical protein